MKAIKAARPTEQGDQPRLSVFFFSQWVSDWADYLKRWSNLSILITSEVFSVAKPLLCLGSRRAKITTARTVGEKKTGFM